MNKPLKKSLNKYFRSIKQSIPGDNSRKKQCLHQFQSSVYNYIEEFSVQNMDDIIQQFGTVEDVVQSYDDESLNLQFSKKTDHLKRQYFFILLFLLCLVLFYFLFLHWSRNREFPEIYVKQEVIFFDTKIQNRTTSLL